MLTKLLTLKRFCVNFCFVCSETPYSPQRNKGLRIGVLGSAVPIAIWIRQQKSRKVASLCQIVMDNVHNILGKIGIKSMKFPLLSA